MSPNRWAIRPYQAGDEEQAAALFGRCFNHPISPAYYLWKIQAGRTPATNCMLALTGERVVGQYAAWRVEAIIEGRRRQVMVAIDGMVDPEFRRQGILKALVSEAHRQWQAEGAACVLAMPNENWGAYREAVGWRKVFPLKWQIRPLRLEQTALRRLGLGLKGIPAPISWLWNRYWGRYVKPDSGVAVEAVSEAGATFDVLWDRLKGNRPLSIVRDAAWMNWRFLSVPDRPYRVLLAHRNGEPVGYIVYWLQSFPGGQAGMVADFLYQPGDVGGRDALVAAVLQALEAAGAETLIGLAVPGTPQSDDLKRIGALLSWGAFDVWILPLDEKVPFTLLEQPLNWLMHGGDFDVV